MNYEKQTQNNIPPLLCTFVLITYKICIEFNYDLSENAIRFKIHEATHENGKNQYITGWI